MSSIESTETLYEFLSPLRESVEGLDRAYEAALRTGASDVAEARKAYQAAKRSYRKAEREAFADGRLWTCGRCGGDGLWKGLRPGVCFNCEGSGLHPRQTPFKFAADPRERLKREDLAKAQRELEEAGVAKALASLPAPVAAALQFVADKYQRLNGFYDPATGEEFSDEESFRYSLYGKLAKYGSLSERQIAAVQRGIDRAAEREAEQAALATAPALVVGKLDIEGEILTTKLQKSQFGATLKMLVKLDDGNKVWGSVPRELEQFTWYTRWYDEHGTYQETPPVTKRLEGCRVAFTATVQRSNDDPHFGFFSRPRKSRLIKEAAAS